MDLEGRHASTQHVMQFFQYSHLPKGRMRDTSKYFADLAEQLVFDLIDGPELTECLRRLLSAKDAGARQALLMDKLEGIR